MKDMFLHMTKYSESNLLVSFASAISKIIVIITSIAVKGAAISVMFNLLVSPVFGIAAITVLDAIGIALVIGFMMKKVDLEKPTTSLMQELISLKTNIYKCLIAVGFAFIFYQFK